MDSGELPLVLVRNKMRMYFMADKLGINVPMDTDEGHPWSRK